MPSVPQSKFLGILGQRVRKALALCPALRLVLDDIHGSDAAVGANLVARDLGLISEPDNVGS